MTETFTIIRDENYNAGYTIGMITIKKIFSFLAILNLNAMGPATKAGLSNKHIGWCIIKVNGVAGEAECIKDMIDKTKTPNQSFTITLHNVIPDENRENICKYYQIIKFKLFITFILYSELKILT